jgi:excisionase family DNA binding protein
MIMSQSVRPRTPQHSALVSIQEAADHCNVHHQTIRRQITAGNLRAYKLGPRILRVDLAEVEALFQPVTTVNKDRQAG